MGNWVRVDFSGKVESSSEIHRIIVYGENIWIDQMVIKPAGLSDVYKSGDGQIFYNNYPWSDEEAN